jgi:hypothetical protein
VFRSSSVDALPIDPEAVGKLKAEGVITVGDLLNKSLDDYGVTLIDDEGAASANG